MRTTGPDFMEVVVEDNDAADKILVINLNGIIGSEPIDGAGLTLAELITDQLKRAGEDEKIRAVLFKIDSPGGEVLASDDIYRAIEKFQKEHKKPVIAAMGGLAASGGYYVAAPCRWIVANELTITGSIGVIMHSYNYRGLMKKVGVRPEVFKSGKFKDMLSGEKDLDELTPGERLLVVEEREMVQSLIEETFGKFKSIVKAGRDNAARANQSEGQKLAKDWVNYADGRILSGKQAHELGFVDELGTLDTAVERAKKIAGLENANLVQYQIPFDLSHLLRFLGKSEAPAVKIDLGLDLPKLQVGRMYFLSPTVIH
jgi:protease-4